MSTGLSFRVIARLTGVALCALLAAASWRPVPAQQQQPQQKPMTSMERGRADSMLGGVYLELKKNYYDPKFHGLDIDARYKTYKERLKQAPTLGEAFRVIAAFLSGLDDSHTVFIPPRRSYRFDYGYRMEMVGDQCFITDVRPESDAAKKLHAGDQVLALGKFSVNRKDFWQLQYYLTSLAPTPATEFTLRDPAGNTHTEQVVTKYLTKFRLTDVTLKGGLSGYWDLVAESEQQQHLLRQRYEENEDLLIWKMPMFTANEEQLGSMIDRARKHRALILDLRGNPGGYESTVKFMVGHLFDHDVKISRRVMRKEQTDLVAASHGHDAFTGQLIVLVDSRSASAAELLARVVQLEHRGTVVGDVTSGSVMEAIYHPLQLGQESLVHSSTQDTQTIDRSQMTAITGREASSDFDIIVFYGANITNADLIMGDGKSLEKVGVTPDVIVLPTAEDLAAGRDPVLAKAAELAHIKLDPAAAGKMFPFEWTPF